MKRKDFFKRLFGVAAVAVIAPSVLVKKEDGYTVPRKSYPSFGIKDPDNFALRLFQKYEGMTFTEFLSIF